MHNIKASSDTSDLQHYLNCIFKTQKNAIKIKNKCIKQKTQSTQKKSSACKTKRKQHTITLTHKKKTQKKQHKNLKSTKNKWRNFDIINHKLINFYIRNVSRKNQINSS